MTTFYVQHTQGRSAIFVNNARVGEAEAPQGGNAVAFGAFNVTSRWEVKLCNTCARTLTPNIETLHPKPQALNR
jgi:hypothetical protein